MKLACEVIVMYSMYIECIHHFYLLFDFRSMTDLESITAPCFVYIVNQIDYASFKSLEYEKLLFKFHSN